MVSCSAKWHSVQISACSVAGEIASSGVPISLMSGWMDQTATSSIHIFYHSAKAPGKHADSGPVELLIDWTQCHMQMETGPCACSFLWCLCCKSNLRLQVRQWQQWAGQQVMSQSSPRED